MQVGLVGEGLVWCPSAVNLYMDAISDTLLPKGTYNIKENRSQPESILMYCHVCLMCSSVNLTMWSQVDCIIHNTLHSESDK